MDLIKELNKEALQKETANVQVGDTVRVHVKVKEGSRERIQVFEGTVNAAMLLGNDGALEDLDTLAGAFLDLHVHADGIAHLHLGNFLLQLLFVQCFDQIHGYFLLFI